ncbi:oligo-1,6-glucosidase, partial [mine drainage metagenome]
AATPWWRGAVIYQIYPRSFLDSDGNGVGDLPGILARLDYIASLGVDAIWIAPFFKSPMADFGYDIADYHAVDPLFGTLHDFDRLLAAAHARGLRVMIDQVLSHTSIEHAWFRESRQSRDNPKADWYVWADAKPDGTPPNNWLSIFGGPAWTWEPRRQQYYLHNFLDAQPDLNFHNPMVRAAALDNVRFWLERGVDGVRLDAINFCFHDALLRDNPPKPAHARTGAASAPTIRMRSSTTGTTTRSPRTWRFWNNCARCSMGIQVPPRWARSRPRIRWRRWPNTPSPGACTWATASSC